MPKRTRTRNFRNLKKQGKKFTNVLRNMIDPRKSNVVRKTLGYVSHKLTNRYKNRTKRYRR